MPNTPPAYYGGSGNITDGDVLKPGQLRSYKGPGFHVNPRGQCRSGKMPDMQRLTLDDTVSTEQSNLKPQNN